MSFPKSFLEELKARVRVSDVVGRKVKLTRRGREWVGLSPFTHEKTPSFTVNDEKQFYHCFSSGEHGDVIKFLEKTENLSFLEAVERLAGEAGLEMPRRTPEDAERERKRAGLGDVMALAADFFRTQLKAGAGAEARAYLERRGLTAEIIDRFGLGFGPDSRIALRDHLGGRGIAISQMIEAGLLIGGADIPEPYDRFRNRVMFPIEDSQGRVIAFGGRALDPNAKAKYLNSPETPLFHKGHVLYNLARARKAAHDTGTIIVVEGYMDVIAVAQAGIDNVVAPLGTALTEQQIELAWRLSPEPVICLDGDAAGHRAAARVQERVLPLLRPGYALRFSYLPAQKDPDDLIREAGAEAFVSLINRSQPLVDAIYEREIRGVPIETPERKAKLSKRLEDLVSSISDPKVQKYYRQSFNLHLSNYFWTYDKTRQGDLSVTSKIVPQPVLELEHERILLGMLVENPDLFDDFHEEVQSAFFESDPHAKFRDELLRIFFLSEVTEVATFYGRIADGFYTLLNLIHGEAIREQGRPRGHRYYARFPIARLRPDHAFMVRALQHFLSVQKLKAMEQHKSEVQVQFEADVIDENYWRLVHLLREIEKVRSLLLADSAELLEWAGHLRVFYDKKYQQDRPQIRKSLGIAA